jgi:hypothetical protein
MAVKAKPVGQKARVVLSSVVRLRETDPSSRTTRLLYAGKTKIDGSRAWLAGVCDQLIAYIDDAHTAGDGCGLKILDRRAKVDQISPQCCSTLAPSVIAEWGLRCEYP